MLGNQDGDHADLTVESQRLLEIGNVTVRSPIGILAPIAAEVA